MKKTNQKVAPIAKGGKAYLDEVSRKTFLYPGMIFLALITIVPSLLGLYCSVNRISQTAEGSKWTFVGLENYKDVLTRAELANSIFVTAVYVTLSIALTIGIGFLLAVLMREKFYGEKLVTSLFILPVVFTPIVSGLIWKFMYMADLGIINYFLGLFGIPGVNWLANPVASFIAVLIVDVWQWTPFCMYFLLAGMQNIPNSQYEAGYIDGANKAQVIIRIISPQLLPISSVVLLFRLMDAFKQFDQIFVITQGGPGRATQTLNLFAYFLGFRYFDYGLACALGVMILILITVICKLVLRLTQNAGEN